MQLVWINDTLILAYKENNCVKFYNTDSYNTDSVQIDNMPTKIKRLDVVDLKSFAFSTEDSIFIYDNDCLERICPQFPNNVILATHDLFAFFPKNQKLILEVVDYNNNELYSNNYLYECDYSGNTSPINLKYGKEYRKFNFGEPRIHYSKFSDGLVLGLEYSKEVSRLTFSDERINIQTTKLGGPFIAGDLYEAKTDDLSDKMDNMFMRLHYSGYFGKIFYDEKEDRIIRIYNFPISNQMIDGSYLNRKDKKKGFLVEGQEYIQHFLPSYRYYTNAFWYYKGTFYYLKWSESDDGQVYYLLDKVKIYNF
jgi:hypothetical protein